MKILRRSAFFGPFTTNQKINKLKWIALATFPVFYYFDLKLMTTNTIVNSLK
jgi:hypothetical protein